MKPISYDDYEELQEKIKQLEAERDLLAAKGRDLAESVTNLLSVSYCDKHQEEIKQMSLNDFISRSQGKCSFCLEDKVERMQRVVDCAKMVDDNAPTPHFPMTSSDSNIIVRVPLIFILTLRQALESLKNTDTSQ